MNIHEYQSKAILKSYGVNVPNGMPAFSVEEAVENAKQLSTPVVVVKAQIHAGGRGKAGGVKIAKNLEEVKQYAGEILGKTLVTKQTGPEGKKVNRLLIEEGSNIKKEYYLSFVIDRQTARVVMMGSEEGGMEIEKVAAEMPDKIFKEYIDPAVGLMPFQASRMAYAMHFPQPAIRKVTKLMGCLYQAFVGKDCSLAEINPLVVTADDDVVALDAKLNFDDSALFRHPDVEALRDESEEDAKERRAAEAGLNYVNLGGDVACMVNGAGLAMATVDIIKYYGGEPANFLDVGGDSTPEKIAEAFNIMLDGGQAKGIFVNIFGGINKCDLVAEGIVEAAKIISPDGKSLPVPVVVRLEGTNVERGREILKNTPIKNVIMAPTMEGGAEEIVRLVKEAEA
ncbi:succinyl-CoA synthetase beta subunit [Selenomonas sp. WCT3]|uniref:ADP-forming succinate--CoA ligase subunit beta n=1 Tax=unclassified Selenomonas TaxID=2637378 RepID=UPI00088910AC|nr:ADP-forming succinate--CoA ligase subunit beta [Selenomonas sp.]MCR5439431.1 ADP-forming succinate--CoA ligase subunit beta [Selenomonas sp.]MDD6133699.1 ADP-forming succinate--CoA ligase subunit beta [Selenomonadaceae bacterium]SDG83100.1 succinyl-CoA synthetase beta subunit [Selenomonas ruminantium]